MFHASIAAEEVRASSLVLRAIKGAETSCPASLAPVSTMPAPILIRPPTSPSESKPRKSVALPAQELDAISNSFTFLAEAAAKLATLLLEDTLARSYSDKPSRLPPEFSSSALKRVSK